MQCIRVETPLGGMQALNLPPSRTSGGLPNCRWFRDGDLLRQPLVFVRERRERAADGVTFQNAKPPQSAPLAESGAQKKAKTSLSDEGNIISEGRMHHWVNFYHYALILRSRNTPCLCLKGAYIFSIKCTPIAYISPVPCASLPKMRLALWGQIFNTN